MFLLIVCLMDYQGCPLPLWKKLNGASFGSDDRPPGAPNTKRALIAVLIDDWPESKIRDALRDDFGIKIQ